MTDERELHQKREEEEQPLDVTNSRIVEGVVDEFFAEQQTLKDLGLEGDALVERSRATLTKSITKGSFTEDLRERGIESPISESEANLLVRQVAFSETLASEELVGALSEGDLTLQNVRAGAEQIMAKSQEKFRPFFSNLRRFFLGNQQAEEDRRSREAFSFVSTELVTVMSEIFQEMEFSTEEESTLWKKVRISLSTTTLLPLTLLHVIRNIPMVESFRHVQDLFWLRRISRVGVKDRHGTLEKGRKPVDKTLQSDGSSHTSMRVHNRETREHLSGLSSSEQMAIRLFASLRGYASAGKGEEFMMMKSVGGLPPMQFIEVGFRTKDRFYSITFTGQEIVDAQSSTQKVSQFISELATLIDAIKHSPNGQIEVPTVVGGSSTRIVESVRLPTGGKRLLQKHAYEGRHSLNAVDESFLSADVCLLVDGHPAGEETNLLNSPEYISGGSHMKEVIAPIVDSQGNIVADATKFSHTWWQGKNGKQKQEQEFQIMQFLSQQYSLKKKAVGGVFHPIDSAHPQVSRLKGVEPNELQQKISMLDEKARAEWTQALKSSESESSKETPRIPPEWLSEHTISFDTVQKWDESVSRIRERWKGEDLRFTVADLMSIAVLLAGDVPSFQGVKAIEKFFEGRDTEVLDVLHISLFNEEIFAGFQYFLQTGDFRQVESKPLRDKLKQYRIVKGRADRGRSWASFLATVTGGIGGGDLTGVVSNISRAEYMAGDDLVNMVRGKHGLFSVLHIPRLGEIQSLLEGKSSQQYNFISANTDSYRPETIDEQSSSKFFGALGVAPGGGWEDGEFRMQGLRITQRLLPDQAYPVIRKYIESGSQYLGSYMQETLYALDNSMRISHQQKDGTQHHYDPDAFYTLLISQNVPEREAQQITTQLNTHIQKKFMPEFLQRIEGAMNWLLATLESEPKSTEETGQLE